MTIDAILFDKDGTLFDFAATWNKWSADVIQTLSNGVDGLAQRLAEAIQFDLASGVFHPHSIAVAGTTGEVAAALLPHLPNHSQQSLETYLGQEAAHAPLAEAVPLPELLDRFRSQGLKLGVMTNDSEISALAQLDRIGVRERFDFIAGCDSGYGAKPDAEPLLAFCSAVGVSPERTIMVGDSLHDLFAARSAGMGRVGVLTGTASRADLSPHADVVLQNIGEIPDWIAQMR